MTRRRWGWWAVALGLLGVIGWVNVPLVTRVFDGSELRVRTLPPAPTFTRGQRILILSPHPDDETLCCGGMIQQARRAGAQVDIAWITAGDGFEFDAALTQRVLRPRAANMRELGQTRTREAGQAAAVLGVAPQHTVMLGYPDGGLFHLYAENYARPYTSPATRASRVYVRGALSPGQTFTGQHLEADITRVLERVQPDLVLVPAPQDFHADHHTLTYLILRLMAQRHQSDLLRFWVVHGGWEWPVPKGYHPSLPLTLPPRATALPWERFDLTEGEEGRGRSAPTAARPQ